MLKYFWKILIKMSDLVYCKQCVLPNTRPNLEIMEDGVCNACHGHKQKEDIDWAKREQELLKLISTVKKRSSGYDCIIPVSGGKDSTWQVKKCKEYGLNILAVTWRTPGRTSLGQENLDNLINLGVDHIDYTINPEVEKKFMYKTFKETGSSAVPMHLSIYTLPLKIAVDFNIPLVIWGESPAMEYGGKDKERNDEKLDVNWMKRHGILQGKLATDWIGDDLSRKELEPYLIPDAEKLKRVDVQSIFLGYYLEWDPEVSLKASLESGFKVRKEGPKLGYYNYADIDCDFISVHHHFKWLKFGFTRLFDNLSIEIRNERMTRSEAIEKVKKIGLQIPHDDIKKYCEFIGMKESEFREIEDSYRNLDIWSRENGVWKLNNFLINDWEW
jgi:N-acetyl sugar amidotransferase